MTLRPIAFAIAATYIFGVAQAQTREPTVQELTAVRYCFAKYEDKLEIETNCLFKLVAEPCMEQEGGYSTHGMADCHRIETKIWDRILNETFRELLAEMKDKEREKKLREMQRAWIVSRDRTCEFYDREIHGSQAIPMGAACMARETARRAILLKAFQGI
ncbi:MAG TPA: lysozyme inhibitor LprI family protein [Xanthobacteraceae bacterium]|jgi:uncharacterized protein YecT (DUF1311 family)